MDFHNRELFAAHIGSVTHLYISYAGRCVPICVPVFRVVGVGAVCDLARSKSLSLRRVAGTFAGALVPRSPVDDLSVHVSI